MTCKRAHRLLAAYRRDDWSSRDRASLGQHLSTCSACRRIEFSYRGVGESVRQLPSITPPPGFREAVFAAIRADEQRMGRAVASLTEADTSPELPIVSVAKRPVSLAAARQRRAAWLNPRIAVVGAAAAIMLGLLATQLLPHANLASFAASLGFARAAENTPLTVAHYMPDTHARSITRALATSGWLVYSAADSAGATTIYAESRQTKSSVPLARGSATAPVALHAVTNDWALWSAGTGSSWTLYAGRINGGANATALLHSGTAATDPSALNGVWANEHVILVAFTTHAGASRVLQLASPAAVPMLLAQTTTPGHTLTDPSADGALVYWVESWRDVSGQHSLLWSRNAAHQTQQLSLSASAFAPHIVRGTLLWVDGQHGTLEARSLTSSQQRWVLAQAVDSASVRVAGETVLWRAGGVLHTWDARTHTSSAVDAQLRTAAWAEASDTSILWAGPGGSINVYDVH
jgi:hypothetical protein